MAGVGTYTADVTEPLHTDSSTLTGVGELGLNLYTVCMEGDDIVKTLLYCVGSFGKIEAAVRDKYMCLFKSATVYIEVVSS